MTQLWINSLWLSLSVSIIGFKFGLREKTYCSAELRSIWKSYTPPELILFWLNQYRPAHLPSGFLQDLVLSQPRVSVLPPSWGMSAATFLSTGQSGLTSPSLGQGLPFWVYLLWFCRFFCPPSANLHSKGSLGAGKIRNQFYISKSPLKISDYVSHSSAL